MKKTTVRRTVVWLVLVLSLGGNLFLAYLVVDNAVTLDDTLSSYRLLRESADESLALIRALSRSREPADIRSIASQLEREGIYAAVYGDSVEVGDVIFKFGSDSTAVVRYREHAW